MTDQKAPTWAYQKGEDGELVSRLFPSPDEIPSGWADSPATIDDSGHHDVKLEDLDKDELERFAKEEFGVDLDKRKSQPKLVAQVRELMDANGN